MTTSVITLVLCSGSVNPTRGFCGKFPSKSMITKIEPLPNYPVKAKAPASSNEQQALHFASYGMPIGDSRHPKLGADPSSVGSSRR